MNKNKKLSGSKKLKLSNSGTLNPFPDEVSDKMFQDSEFFDPNDLLQVKYEMLRSNEKDARPVALAARDFGFSRRHFYEIRKQFLESGMLGLVPEKRGPKQAHKLDGTVMSFILKAVADAPSLKSPALAALIKNEFEITVHPRSIERALKRKKKDRSK